jgi:hypothetical protein
VELHLIMPTVEPENITHPATCKHCNGKDLRLQQKIKKNLRDTIHEEVVVYRYQCLTCHRTFRVYPQGVTKAQISERIRGFAVSIYLMGYSHRKVELFVKNYLKQELTRSQIHNIIRPITQIANLKQIVIIDDTSLVKGLMVERDKTILTIEEGNLEKLINLIEPIAKIAGARVIVVTGTDR